MYTTIFFLLVFIVVFSFIFDRWLEYLNLTKSGGELPPEISDVYEPERYKTSVEYKRVNTRFGWLTSSFGFAATLLMLIFGGFGYLNDLAWQVSSIYILVFLAFFAILALASDLLNLPFSIYDTFVIEERFGFNKMTPGLFITDKLKSWLLGGLIGGGLAAVVVWFYQQTGKSFWVWAWILVSGFMILMTMFYSNLIVPLFNRQTPLEEGELRTAIEECGNRAGFRIDNIYVIDGSKRSTKSNAYFTGLGKKKRIVLYDTLVNDLEKEEIVAVLAHEIGHYRKKHTLLSAVLSIAQAGLSLFIFSLFLEEPALSAALGVEEPNFHLSVIAFAIIYSPVSSVIGLFFNYMSRKNEYAADRFAAQYADGEKLISALKKLTSKNLSNLTPHPLYVKVHYSHPTLLDRIRALSKAS
jgi:STE24 endopeptidase